MKYYNYSYKYAFWINNVDWKWFSETIIKNDDNKLYLQKMKSLKSMINNLHHAEALKIIILSKRRLLTKFPLSDEKKVSSWNAHIKNEFSLGFRECLDKAHLQSN